MESNVYHIMSLSSILLLKPRRIHEDLQNTFEPANIDALMDQFQRAFAVGKYGKTLDNDLFKRLKSIVKDVYDGNITRLSAQCCLYPMASEASLIDSKMILSVARL
ncbi:hypothetical protein BJV82DRAFT_303653 [Fennellomyces sp. T-0311]|nr:hypothetical protein BJV82DRAFT_303653 [Fennellomyces sp. T-0311]